MRKADYIMIHAHADEMVRVHIFPEDIDLDVPLKSLPPAVAAAVTAARDALLTHHAATWHEPKPPRDVEADDQKARAKVPDFMLPPEQQGQPKAVRKPRSKAD